MLKKYNKIIKKASDYRLISEDCLMIRGDSLEIIPSVGIDVDSVITDPPYVFDSRGGKLFGREKASFYDMRDRDLDKGFDMRILGRLSKQADQMIVFMHNDQIFNMLASLTQFKGNIEPLYPRFALCQWHKSDPMPVANKHYIPDTELYIHVWRKPAFPQGELSDKNRWILHSSGRSDIDHPTVKPIKIMIKCVMNASAVGQTVIDPFAGSGSTGVACLMKGRKFIGIEKDPKFFEIACKRLADVSGVKYECQGDAQQSLL